MLLAAVAVLLAGCGGDSDEESATGEAEGGDSGADIEYVTSQVEEFKGDPSFPDLPPIDATQAQGKRVALIPFTSAVPFIASSTQSVADALELAGVEATIFPSQGQLSQIQQAFSSAIGQRYDAIATFSVNAESVGPQIAAAKQRDIPVVIGHVDPTGAPVPENASAHTPAPFYEAGRLEADYVIMDSEGDANTLVITSNEQTPARGTVEAIEDEFETRCGEGCTTTVVNVPIADWAQKMQSQVQSSLTRDPSISYIIPLYDSGVQFVLPGIRTAGASDRVKVVTFNGTPFVLDEIAREDIVIADVGESTTWLGWAIADQLFRLLVDEPPVDDPQTPLKIFDDSNVAEAGSPAKLGEGYGAAYIDGYKETWGVE